MFILGFCASLGSAYFRYYELEKIEKEHNNIKAGQELKDFEIKV